MDTDTLELLLAELLTIWRGPMSGVERAVWRRTLRPDAGQSLDPQIAAEALLSLKHSIQFETNRPTVASFIAAYDRASKPKRLATTEVTSEALRRCRSVLDVETVSA
jgi:hypothetical protein